MTPGQRNVLIERLSMIINAATYARDCLHRNADNDGKKYMIETENQAAFLNTIRERQGQ
jgi:hypothetical protein